MKLTDKIEVLNEDCMQVMSRYPDKYFDLAVVDPPYGLGIASSGGFYYRVGKGQANPHKKNDWDSSIPPPNTF
jgi:site-specific DNA-methyltransferase (adenine-specific)